MTPGILQTSDERTEVNLIANLNIYVGRFTLVARLINKSAVHSWSNAKGEGRLFSIELLDNSGVDIRGTFFKEAVDKFYDMLQVGKVYRVTGGRLKVANTKYNDCKSSFEITFDQNTEVHLDNDDAAISRVQYEFVKIADISNHEPNKTIDVLAVVKSVGAINRITSRKTGQEMEKCDLILVDDSGVEISMTLWREKALEAPTKFRSQPVVAFRRARISDYGGRTLAYGVDDEVNPNYFKGFVLKFWWLSLNRTSTCTTIENLVLGRGQCEIMARVTSKSEIRSWSNAKGEGRLFSIELLDNSGVDIRGTFFKEAVDKFYDMLQVGKVYRVTGGRLKVANTKYNCCKSSFEITFDQNTEVHRENDNGSIPHNVPYEFVKIADISNHEPNKTIDVLAVVKSVGAISRITSRKTGQEMEKCDLILVDDSGVEISMTLWREKALEALTKFRSQPVVAFRRARISDYGGRTLAYGTDAEVHPPEGQALAHWWKQTGQHMVATSLSLSGSGGGKAVSLIERDDIRCIKENNLGRSEKGDFVTFKAAISFFKKDKEGGAWYPACPNENEPCKQRVKVTQTPDGHWQCDRCHGTFNSCIYRWIFSGVVEDGSSSTWVSFFNEQAESLLGATANEAYQQSHQDMGNMDQTVHDSFFQEALFSEWVFRCRVKNEPVNDEMRTKTTVMSMWPVNYEDECKQLLSAIEAL